MKLNNQQVSALADKIYKQVSDKINKENKQLDKLADFNKWKKENKPIVDALTEAVNSCKQYVKLANITYSYNDFLRVSEVSIEKELKSKFKEGVEYRKYPDQYSIKQDIILETIECENLDSIITKLVDKYTK